ncbi:oxoprolinase 1 [Pelomyxa schiedti]|nr:oxoprolinase 1 [Pelomyxa schiedti]
MSTKVHFAIDRGGTFTDVFARVVTENKHGAVEERVVVHKLLSKDHSYSDAPREGIRVVLEKVLGTALPRSEPVPTRNIGSIRMGTTVATNALLERKGVPTVLCITQGFADLLFIGNQTRPRLFDLNIVRPELIYSEVVEVEERVVLAKDLPQGFSADGRTIFQTVSGEFVHVEKPINVDNLRQSLQKLYDTGIRSIAVVLVHSYLFPNHELEVGRIASSIGFEQVSLSSQLAPMVKVVPRGQTACVDAYLTPLIREYVKSFSAGFDSNFPNVDVTFMMSDGGLCPVSELNGFKSILSGPAGGVVGYSLTTWSVVKSPVIGFDMGGTSTDVSRFAGELEHVIETVTAGVSIMTPQLDITTVAAGGGSRLFFKSGLFLAGPESSGANPGPVCYRKGGYLSITDANLFLGRILPRFFPSIFGPSNDLPLDCEATRAAFEHITVEVNEWLSVNSGRKSMTPEEVALGFIRVANETMCRPIRGLTEMRGLDPAHHVLACFGGAGGQHCCTVARLLGIRKVFVHRYASILSAVGLSLADKVYEAQAPSSLKYSPETIDAIYSRFNFLAEEPTSRLRKLGFSDSNIKITRILNLRYQGMDASHTIKEPEDKDFKIAFEKQYEREYGFRVNNRDIIVDDIRVRCVGQSPQFQLPLAEVSAETPTPCSVTRTYFEDGWKDVGVFMFEKLLTGHKIMGPAIVVGNYTTIVVPADCLVNVTASGDLLIDIGDSERITANEGVDPIMLSLFSNRFMSIAEQMGKVLQRTAVSTNIKERLDFSCAIFDPNGGLVANAPHLPVHLGSMADAVNWQIKSLGESWKEGEVVVSNHPSCAGSHLPDITVMTPVHHSGRPVFYVASRGHHADIGGITPGSMPPFSTSLEDEGARIKTFKLVENSQFQEEGITHLMCTQGGNAPRRMADVLNDLRAQIAANHKGVCLIRELIAAYTLDVVVAYMYHVQHNAEQAVREVLTQLSLQERLDPVGSLVSEDFMDDGTPIRLRITINRNDGSALFDFNGSGFQTLTNCNTPPSVTKSAVLYCLRCLVKRDIPLNNGCLIPIKIILPSGSILNPSEDAAVVGGNVLTSQRITDVILSAFKASACSQGCMNNFTFGDETFGYYETIAGGSGAGPSWNGESAVQVHMTNTRITDVEIMERRYPIILRSFSVRKGSGGKGKHNGGNGVVRSFEFTKPLTIGILSERRVFAPRGLEGGTDGSKGLNLLYRKGAETPINLGGKNSCRVRPGDKFIIMTPGGGGFGSL